VNQLKHIDEFRNALVDYHLSKFALQSLSQTKLVLLVATTSSGRNTIIRELLKTGNYHYVVSDTTRAPRTNDGIPEQPGKEYWFRSEEEVLQDLKTGLYLEAAIIHDQQVSGISVRELELARDEDKIAITDIEVIGAENSKKYKHDVICIFVLPPSFEEWQSRLKHRGEMTPPEFKRRMESACAEFETALSHDYYQFVINDMIEDATRQINEIAELETSNISNQTAGKQLAEQLLISTKALVASL
jgi:guanylate kinase